uniref:Uncharacterized protein n=1 Tax=viral metagenome TaxID=1070528 RepID=A0A6M3KHI0_9ZZZZ
MKKMVALTLGLVLAVLAGDLADIGVTWLKDNTGSTYLNTVVATTAAVDSSYSAVYSFAGDVVPYYNSLRVVLDSVRGTFSIAIDLQESFDGVSWEFNNTILSMELDASREDTIVEVNFYPTPYFRFLIRETDAGTGESLYVDTLQLFSVQ